MRKREIMDRQINAFDWKEYTNEERARKGDPFKEIKRNAAISATTTAGIHKLREEKPSHGTILGITEKRISLRAPDMMPMGGARPNSGRKLPAINEERAMSLLAKGLTKREIADTMGIPYKSMLTFFKKKGAIQTRGLYAWAGTHKKEA